MPENKNLSVSINADLADALDAYCEKLGVQKRFLVELLIKLLLESKIRITLYQGAMIADISRY